jgi:hypothetical protein
VSRPILGIRAAPKRLTRDPIHDKRTPNFEQLRKEAGEAIAPFLPPKVTLEQQQENQRQRRKWLYDNDPIWRLTKNKDNRERRLRKKLQLEQGA